MQNIHAAVNFGTHIQRQARLSELT